MYGVKIHFKIWMLLIQQFNELDCEYISHSHCLNSVKRVCASVKVNENPQYILELCPEKKIGAQNYRCFECKSGISFSKYFFLCCIIYVSGGQNSLIFVLI